MKQIEKPKRDYWVILLWLFALLTASIAFIAVMLSLLGFVMLTTADQIVLTVFGLLAFNILIERIRILEQIRHDVGSLKKGSTFQPYLIWETDLLAKKPLSSFLQEADKLFISGGSLFGLFSRESELISDWLRGKSRKKKIPELRLILEDPKAALINNTPIWSSRLGREKYVENIRTSLDMIESLIEEFPDQIKTRVTDQVPGLTVMIVDENKARIHLNLYRGGPEKRPVFEVSRTEHPDWFRLFEDRYYDQLWKESVEWKGTSGDITNSKEKT
jgi:hypothetical protein